MAIVILGSKAPKAPVSGTQALANGAPAQEDKSADLPSQTEVLIEVPDEYRLDKQLKEVRDAFSLHSHEDAAWVEGGDPDFTKAVAAVFDCPVGRPKGWSGPVAPPQSRLVKTGNLVSKVNFDNPDNGVTE